MTRSSQSKFHGLHSVDITRPKSTLRKRRNKARARQLRSLRRA